MATPAEAAPAVYRRRFLPRAQAPAAAIAGGIVILLLVVVAIFAPLIAPYDPNAIDLGNTLAGSSPEHLLGTDASGRDILPPGRVGNELVCVAEHRYHPEFGEGPWHLLPRDVVWRSSDTAADVAV